MMRAYLAAIAAATAMTTLGAVPVPVEAREARGKATATRPAPPPPPYAGVYQPQGVDEIGLWREDDEDERALANSPLLLRDEALTAYVRSVLCATVGPDRCNATRLYIIREPTSNASMVPNGTMRVHSGMLLRMRSEAELAAVLGHEFGHFERRHGLKKFKAGRSSTDALGWAWVLASMSRSPTAAYDFRTTELAIYGRFFRFSRDMEREADLAGLGYLNASGLLPHAASRFWTSAMAEAEASARVRGLSKPQFDRIAYFATHPPDAEREGYLAALADPAAAARDEGADRYRSALARWMPVFLDDQIKLNDFGASDYVIGMLAEGGWTPQLWLARGELYRLRGTPRDHVNAIDFYSSAIALDPALADAHRGLGLSRVKAGLVSDGVASLKTYLSLKPDAPDASMITMTITSLEGAQ